MDQLYPLRIAVFTDNFYPELSGISDSIMTTCQQFGNLGHHVIIFAPKATKNEFNVAKIPQNEVDLGKNVEIKRLPSLPFPGSPTRQSRIAIPLFFRNAILLKKIQPHVIHIHLMFGAGLEGIMIAKALNIPLIGTNHTPITEFTPYLLKSKIVNMLGQKYVSWLYNQCRFISAPSQSIITEMKDHGFNRSSQVISNPIKTNQFALPSTEQKNSAKKKFGLSEKTIIYTGRLAREKHIDILINAVAEIRKSIPEINLIITGVGDNENNLREQVKNLHLDNNIKFFGYLDLKSLIELHYAAEMFAIASTAEAQCISMLQAMAAGLPVVAARARGLPEYINPEIGLLAEPFNINDFTKQILILFQNKKKLITMGKAAHLFAQKYSVEKIAKMWEKIYQKEIKQ